MSTYTDLHTRIKENLTILRMPGNPNDGITGQRVIFANPENIYEGTFKGIVQPSALVLDGTTIKNATFVDATLSSSTNGVVDVF